MTKEEEIQFCPRCQQDQPMEYLFNEATKYGNIKNLACTICNLVLQVKEPPSYWQYDTYHQYGRTEHKGY